MELGQLFEDLFMRWHQTGERPALEQAIVAGNQALAAPDLGQDLLGVVSANLCMALTERYHLTHDRADIDAAVRHGSNALRNTSSDEPAARFASNLAASLNDRYDAFGDQADLDTAIRLLNAAVSATAASDPGRPGRIMNLATALARRFNARQDPADIEAAIGYGKEVVASTAPGDPRLSQRQANLAMMERLRPVASGGGSAAPAGTNLGTTAGYAAALDAARQAHDKRRG
jgi:hypothetical protein